MHTHARTRFTFGLLAGSCGGTVDSRLPIITQRHIIGLEPERVGSVDRSFFFLSLVVSLRLDDARSLVRSIRREGFHDLLPSEKPVERLGFCNELRPSLSLSLSVCQS